MSASLNRPVRSLRLLFLLVLCLALAIPALADVGGGCSCPPSQNGCPLSGAEVIDGRLTCFFDGEIDSETLCSGVGECPRDLDHLVTIFDIKVPKGKARMSRVQGPRG